MQTNVLLNYYNFHEDWAYPTLKPLIEGKRTLIIPLAYRPSQAWDEASWQSVYGVGGEKYANIMAPFARYGISGSNLQWLDYYDDTNKAEQLKWAQVLFFTGGMPEKAIQRLADLGLTELVRNFDGVVMGASAGAMLQLAVYHVTPDEDYAEYGIWQGLGMVKGLDLEVHYLATDLQQACSLRAAQELRLPVYQMEHQGGLVYQDGIVTPMGKVTCIK